MRQFSSSQKHPWICGLLHRLALGICLVLFAHPVHAGADTVADKTWAFNKWLSVTPPRVERDVWSRNPVDVFILQKLREQRLTPSPEADPATLLRRLTLDLIGLPPSPEEIRAFRADPSPQAYDRAVERLLGSPRYGERWARHWLDVVRFGESQGFEYDHMRENAWPYRDYVIRAFNSDKPYGQFMREQIAGDVLEPVTREGIVATSLLVCGPWDQAGSGQANETQRLATREEEMEDLLSVIGQGLLGLTLNCARCHSHKFDPIPQVDYYRVKSVFDGVRHGERVWATPEEERSPMPGTVPKLMIYAGKREQPAPTRRLKRGSVTTPAEIVSPGGLSAVHGLNPDFGLDPAAPEGERRRKFAEWLTDAVNPLPARVLVNRVWQYHFGAGLVGTANDFGAGGAGPTHPELLDWLASQFMAGGGSIKNLHRLIVTSATYRQRSDFRKSAADQDADNKFLWRMTPRRLEAEVLRDSMLMVSGDLNSQMEGPSFRPFDTKSFNATFYFPADKQGAEYNRRTVYRMNINSGKDPLLEAFDCPDPSVKTPRRGLTTTPLQALELMNNSFVQRQAAALARRVRREASRDDARAIRRAYWHCLGREPAPDELRHAEIVAAQTGLENVCWALLNTTEFVYAR